MVAAEFHGLDLVCSSKSIIPQGLNFENVEYQSCAIAGSTSGSLVVSGDNYIAAQFGYYYNNVWRNFGIMLLFTVAFILLAAVFSELLEWNSEGGGALQFKKSVTSKSHATSGRDEEEKPVQADSGPDPRSAVSGHQSTIPVNLETSTETFTWKDLTYTIPYD